MELLKGIGFTDVELVSKVDVFVDVFKGAGGEEKARKFDTVAANFRARKPASS